MGKIIQYIKKGSVWVIPAYMIYALINKIIYENPWMAQAIDHNSPLFDSGFINKLSMYMAIGLISIPLLLLSSIIWWRAKNVIVRQCAAYLAYGGIFFLTFDLRLHYYPNLFFADVVIAAGFTYLAVREIYKETMPACAELAS